jgi:hypothetical protein
MTQDETAAALEIPSALDLEEAQRAHAALLAEVEGIGAGTPVRLEIAAGRPTVPALQLLIATWRSLVARGAAVTPGPAAAARLADLAPDRSRDRADPATG